MTCRHALFLISSRQSFIAETERAAAGAAATGAIRFAGRAASTGASAVQAGIEALRTGSASVILVDLDSGMPEALRTLEDLARLAPEARVLVASANRDPDLILRAMRAGAVDFLPLPLERAILGEALSRAMRRGAAETAAATARGRVMSFVGAKGGCGATSVAVNLAVSLCAPASKEPRSVVLVDLDNPGGDAAAMLNLRPAYSLADLAANIHRLDMDLLNSMALSHESGLICLGASEGSVAGRLTPDEMATIVTFLHEHYDDVVLAGGVLGDVEMAAVNLAHMVHVVTTLDFLSLKRAQSIITRLRAFGVTGDALRVVVNKLERGSDLTARDAKQALDAPVVWSIPNDPKTADRAVNEGVPYAAKGKTRLLAAFEEYATLLAGETASAPDSGSVGRLFRRLVPGRAGMPA
jgi:pilus assembly protein CpaE